MTEVASASATLPARPSVLPDAWINRLFAQMSGMYGSKFADLWGSSDLSDVKAIWAQKLGGFADKPECIKAALDGLDERPFPPTLPEFLTLCRTATNRRGTYTAALPAPAMSPQEAARRLDEIKARAPKEQKPGLDPRGWCKELKKRYLAGEKLNSIQIQMAQEAMGEKWAQGKCERAAA